MRGQEETCPACGGSGEIGFFLGESRFLLTREECPLCCGTGRAPEEEEAGAGTQANGQARRGGERRKDG